MFTRHPGDCYRVGALGPLPVLPVGLLDSRPVAAVPWVGTTTCGELTPVGFEGQHDQEPAGVVASGAPWTREPPCPLGTAGSRTCASAGSVAESAYGGTTRASRVCDRLRRGPSHSPFPRGVVGPGVRTARPTCVGKLRASVLVRAVAGAPATPRGTSGREPGPSCIDRRASRPPGGGPRPNSGGGPRPNDLQRQDGYPGSKLLPGGHPCPGGPSLRGPRFGGVHGARVPAVKGRGATTRSVACP